MADIDITDETLDDAPDGAGSGMEDDSTPDPGIDSDVHDDADREDDGYDQPTDKDIGTGGDEPPHSTTPDVPPPQDIEYVTKEVEQEEWITDYSSSSLADYEASGAIARAVYDDGTEVDVGWSEVYDPSAPERTATDEAMELVEAVNQHFWQRSDDEEGDGAGTGAFVTDEEQADFLEAAADGFPDQSDSKPWHNLLMNSLGILLRSGLKNLVSITRSAIAFFDGSGNEADNVVAMFGKDGALVGKSNESHVEIGSNLLTFDGGDGGRLTMNGSSITMGHGNISTVEIVPAEKAVAEEASFLCTEDAMVLGGNVGDTLEVNFSEHIRMIAPGYYPEINIQFDDDFTKEGKSWVSLYLGSNNYTKNLLGKWDSSLGETVYHATVSYDHAAKITITRAVAGDAVTFSDMRMRGKFVYNIPKFTFGYRSMGEDEGGPFSLCAGSGNVASGHSAAAIGAYLKASGDWSFAEGKYNEASGYYSHAEGQGNKSINYASHAEGWSCSANGEYSHAEGCSTYANGKTSHSQNYNTNAFSDYQTAIGKFNVIDMSSKYALIVGNGSTSKRSNALAVRWNGLVDIGGTSSVDTSPNDDYETAYPTFVKASWSESSDESTLPVTPCFVLNPTNSAYYYCDGQ